MMKAEIAEVVSEWIKKAKEDLMVAQTLSKSGSEILVFLIPAIGFHSQQCVEKCLKAFLTSKQNSFRKSHDIDYLLNLCEANTKQYGFLRSATDLLNDFAVEARCPGVDSEFVLQEAMEILEVAAKVYENTNILIEQSVN